MALIKKHHVVTCTGDSCGCPWRLDYRPMGLRGPRKRIEFPTKKAAEKYLSETNHKVARGEYIEPARVPTFKEAAERWFVSKIDRRPGYVADMRSRLDKHLLPKLGEQRLDRITVGRIEELRDNLRKKFAAATVRQIVQIVGAVFKGAIRRGECTINPVDRIERNYTAARELTGDNEGSNADAEVDPDSILAPDEVGAMLRAARPEYSALLTTLALTGMRSGEAFAARWTDVELPKSGPAYLYVRRTVTWARVAGEEIRPRFYPPKTKAGLRKIPLTPELARVLRVWKLACPPSPDNLIFPAADGRPIRRSNALRYGLWPALKGAGLRQVNMHSLRHSFASALIARGAAVTEVQHLLGHASPAITLKIYSHWFQSIESGAVGLLSKAILGNDASAAKMWAQSGHRDGGIPAGDAINA